MVKMKEIKNRIKLLAKELMFELSETDIESICDEFHVIEDQLKSISNISTINVQPTNFCIEFESTPLREDTIVEEDDKPFSNCKLLKDKYVVIKNEK